MGEERKYVNWTPEKLERFRKAHKEAVQTEQDQFTFDGNDFIPEYAKFLIEYLDMTFGRVRH